MARGIRTALASWTLDAILKGVAVFEGKEEAGTLPHGVDGCTQSRRRKD